MRLEDTEGTPLERMVRVRRSVPQLRRVDVGCVLLLTAVPLLMLAVPIAVMPAPARAPGWRCYCGPSTDRRPLTSVHVLFDGWYLYGAEPAHTRVPTTMSQSFAIGHEGYYFNAAGLGLRVDAWLGDEEDAPPMAVRDYRRPLGSGRRSYSADIFAGIRSRARPHARSAGCAFRSSAQTALVELKSRERRHAAWASNALFEPSQGTTGSAVAQSSPSRTATAVQPGR